MNDPPADHAPPAFAARLVEQALARGTGSRLDPSIARLIAATLAADKRPALDHFARTGELDAATARTELAEIRQPPRPAWLDALRQFLDADPHSHQPSSERK